MLKIKVPLYLSQHECHYSVSLLFDIYSPHTDSETSRVAFRYSFLMFQAFPLTVLYFLYTFIRSKPSFASFVRVIRHSVSRNRSTDTGEKRDKYTECSITET
jgi:hypothetical protein